MNIIGTSRKRLGFTYSAIFLIFLIFPAVSFAAIVGPYTGRVLDSRTGEPITGASVLIYWEKGIQFIEHDSYPIKSVLVQTDDDGCYEIPRQFLYTGIWYLENTTLIIYQPGYHAYIKSIDISDKSTFAFKNNLVKFERIQPHFDYKAHYRKIIDALRGLEIDYMADFDPITGKALSTEEIIERETIMIERLKFVRRIEWEEQRGE